MTTAIKNENDPALAQIQSPSRTYTHSKLDERVSSSAQKALSCKMHVEDWNGEDAYKEGIRSLAQGHHHSALKHFSLAIELNPEFPDALYMRASIYIQQQSLGAAVKDLEKIIAQFEENAESITAPLGHFELGVLKQLASLHLQMENYPTAISCTLRGLHHDLKDTDFMILSARIYEKLGSIDAALKEIEKVLAIRPFHYEAVLLHHRLRMNGDENANRVSPPPRISAPDIGFIGETAPECADQ